ncbi:hypothetical protein Adt_26699 [Abeliophyllum distichum]|uniref:Uncharacterized protein n=1 Tax=Abeliophyllum distichum TaxID=126358 RepID=A0ABD1RSB8_9LAMI
MPRPGVAWRHCFVIIGCFRHSSRLLKNSPVGPSGFAIDILLISLMKCCGIGKMEMVLFWALFRNGPIYVGPSRPIDFMGWAGIGWALKELKAFSPNTNYRLFSKGN